MTRNRLFALASLTAVAMVPALAMAHPGHGVGQNFVAGMMHPLTGLDHILMIVAVSAWAGAMPRTGRVIVPACLAVFVAIGALAPVQISGPALEASVALTVMGAGMLLALGHRWPTWATAVLAALFALIHGFAHGAEGPMESLTYVPGLAAATGGLALAVSFLAAGLQSHRGWMRSIGLASATFGVVALFNA
ncbi:MAG: HupE/UreJ family protein [Pseudomonadota bacterium]